MNKPETMEAYLEEFGALAILVARDWHSVGDLEDLEQEATLALLEAYNVLDWDRVRDRTGFNAFARKHIRTALQAYSAANSFATSGSRASMGRHEFHASASLDAIGLADAEDFTYRPDPSDRRTTADAITSLQERHGLSYAEAVAWLKGRERALDLSERRAPEEESASSAAPWHPESTNEQDAEELDAIMSTMDSLTARQRRVIGLYYLDGILSDTKVADVLGVTQQSVQGVRAKAEERIKEILEG